LFRPINLVSNVRMEPSSSLGVELMRALAQRARAASRWRTLARGVCGQPDCRCNAMLARLSVSEHEHAERLAREALMIESIDTPPGSESWARRAQADSAARDEGRGATADSPRSGPAETSMARALEDAMREERRLRDLLEQVAATSPSNEVRLRALALALAESRHLAAIEEALASVCGTLGGAGTGCH
jgi:hypothetical protein